MMTWLCASLILVAPPAKAEPSPEPALARSKADLLLEARLKRGLKKEVYEKAKDCRYKFECRTKSGKVFIFATDEMEFADGQAKIQTFYGVVHREGGEAMNPHSGRTAPDSYFSLEFDRKVKSFADVKKARRLILIQINTTGGGYYRP